MKIWHACFWKEWLFSTRISVWANLEQKSHTLVNWLARPSWQPVEHMIPETDLNDFIGLGIHCHCRAAVTHRWKITEPKWMPTLNMYERKWWGKASVSTVSLPSHMADVSCQSIFCTVSPKNATASDALIHLNLWMISSLAMSTFSPVGSQSSNGVCTEWTWSMHYGGISISVHSVLCQCIHTSTCIPKPFEDSQLMGLEVDIANSLKVATWSYCSTFLCVLHTCPLGFASFWSSARSMTRQPCALYLEASHLWVCLFWCWVWEALYPEGLCSHEISVITL